jgi:hypothetical protein
MEHEIRRMHFETRADEEHYIAVARGFGDADEMRTFYKTHSTPGSTGGRRVETRSTGAGDYARRLTVLKLSEVE